MWNDTILIYTSDNGGEVYDRTKDPIIDEATYSYGCNWPLRGGKFTVWEGGVRVPAFVHSPLLPSNVVGTINNGLLHASDIYPTIVQGILGLSTSDSQPLDGINSWGAIISGVPTPRTEVLVNVDLYDGLSGALINGTWKLVVGANAVIQIETTEPAHVPPPSLEGTSPCAIDTGSNSTIRLYNIITDPSECVNVAEQNPLVAFQLLKRYLELSQQAEVPNFPFTDPNSNPEFFNGYWAPWQSDDGTPLAENPVTVNTCDLNALLTTVRNNLDQLTD
jgi:arylsulfatase A-like enzyme